jgi:hypothetical protein
MIEIRCACGCVYRADETRIGSIAQCPNLACGITLRVERRDLIALQPVAPITLEDSIRESTARSSGPQKALRLRKDAKIVLAIAAGFAVICGVAWLISRQLNEPIPPLQYPPSTPTSPPTEEEMRNSPNSEAYIKPLPPPPKVSEQPHLNLKPLKTIEVPKPVPESRSISEEEAEPIVVTPACAVGQIPIRPETGYRLADDERTSGESSLEINNGLNVDAVVRLVDTNTNRTSRLVYVRAKDVYTIGQIEPSTYSLRFVSGLDWIPACMDFLRDSDMSEFENQRVFREGYVSKWTVWLNPVLYGNAKTRKIDKKRFLEGDQHFSLQQ